MAKRLKIVLGYSVLDEEQSGGEFFDCGIVYRDAPLDVLQAVHEVMLKHGPALFTSLAPIAEELTEIGYAAAELKGVSNQNLELVKEKLGGKKKGRD